MARGISLVIIGGIWQISFGACADGCLGFQGAEARAHRWNWNKWGRNKLPDNDIEDDAFRRKPSICRLKGKKTEFDDLGKNT